MKKRRRRARRRANPRRTARRTRTVAIVANPRRRGRARRRRNGGGFFANLKPVLLASAGCIGGIIVGTKVAEAAPETFADPKKGALLQAGLGVLGGLALYKYSPPAALGAGGGLAGLAVYTAFVAPAMTAEAPAATAGVFTQGDPYSMGAVETTGAVYDDVPVSGDY